MTRLATSSITVTRTEKIRVTVMHPADWTREQVQDAALSAGEDLDEALGDVDEILLRIKRVDLGSKTCDVEGWIPLDLSDFDEFDDDEDDDDDDGDFEDNDE